MKKKVKRKEREGSALLRDGWASLVVVVDGVYTTREQRLNVPLMQLTCSHAGSTVLPLRGFFGNMEAHFSGEEDVKN